MSELFIGYDWEPPIEDTYLAASAVGTFMADMYDVLVGAREIAMDDMQQRFDTETDPYGQAWERLTEDYETKKQEDGYAGGILVRNEDLKNAATSDSAWTIAGEDLFFNAGQLPEYGLAHQFGASRSKGGVLPQRQFIGLSDEAMIEMEALGDYKVDVAEEIWVTEPPDFSNPKKFYVHPTGAIQTRKKGQFGPKFSPEF